MCVAFLFNKVFSRVTNRIGWLGELEMAAQMQIYE